MGEVREYKYLRYVVKYNGKQEAHKRESEEESGAFGEGMGKNRFGADWRRRIWLFDS